MNERTRRKWIGIALAVMMMLAGIMPAGVFAQTEPAAAEAADPGSAMHALDASDDVASMVAQMSTEQKITQCFMMDFRKWNDQSGEPQSMTVLNDDVAEIIADYQFGAVILYGGNIRETGETLALTKAMQRAVQSKGGLPLIVATDQEGGLVYRLGSGTALPGNMALCATGDTENAVISGRIIGRELRTVGINTTLAPVLDVNVNANNPIIGIRAFSDDADMTGTFGKAYMDGLRESAIIGCAKHFPGHGDTDTDSHTGLPLVDKPLSELRKTELKPFRDAIDHGADMIMTAHIIYPQVDGGTIHSEKTGQDEKIPATLSKKFLTDLIRGEMNYDGVVITDAMDMDGIDEFFTEDQAALEAFKAGADIICMPVSGVYEKDELKRRLDVVISRIKASVESGELSEDRLNEAVTRVLTLKRDNGILGYDEGDYPEEAAYKTVGCAEHRELERTISAKAVTLVRNENYTLPYNVSNGTRILMMTPYDSEGAQMVMGFNRAKKAGMLPSEAEVRVFSFQKYAGGIEGKLKEDLDWADLVIIGSELYNAGDMAYEEDHWRSVTPLAATEYCRSAGKKSVIMSTNIPYDVQLYPAADAVIAVYGCEISSVDVDEAIAEGITESKDACGPNIIAGVEVIFGVFDAAGRLPVNVPVFDPAVKEYTDRIAYSRGYGLAYDKTMYSIVYKLNGGSCKGSTDDIVEKYRAGTVITVHEAPVRKGYTFEYWEDGSGYKAGDRFTVDGDHTFKAVWKKAGTASKAVIAARAAAVGRTSLKISWNKVEGAAKYEVWLAKCGKNSKLKKVKTLRASKTGWTRKKLKKNTAYKFRIVAKDASGNVLSRSLTGHVYTGNVRGGYTNAKSLRVSKKSFTLSKGDTAKIRATQKKARKGKKLCRHAELLRYRSTDTSVAKVDSKGKIRAAGAGKCRVYVQTVNGIWQTVNINVR